MCSTDKDLIQTHMLTTTNVDLAYEILKQNPIFKVPTVETWTVSEEKMSVSVHREEEYSYDVTGMYKTKSLCTQIKTIYQSYYTFF